MIFTYIIQKVLLLQKSNHKISLPNLNLKTFCFLNLPTDWMRQLDSGVTILDFVRWVSIVTSFLRYQRRS